MAVSSVRALAFRAKNARDESIDRRYARNDGDRPVFEGSKPDANVKFSNLHDYLNDFNFVVGPIF